MTSLPRRLFIRASICGLLLGGLWVGAGCDGTSAAFRATRTTQVAHAAGSALKVGTDNGNVDVTAGATANVEVTAHLRARTQERLDATSIAVVRDASGVLSIGVDWPDGHRKNSEGCDFEIKVPDAHDVTIETSNGHIHIAGLSGLADLSTSNGRIEVAGHDGEVRAHTSNGEVIADGVKGKAKARTSNGAIELSGVTGEASAQTSNGSIAVRLEPTSRGPVFAESSNGSIALELGPSFEGSLRMDTSNGTIQVDGADATGGKESKRLKFGAGGTESSANTSNGKIHVIVKK